MLNVLLMDHDFYQRKGLSILIYEQLAEKGYCPVCFLLPSQEENQNLANILFRKDMVTIHVFNKIQNNNRDDLIQEEPQKLTIHVPFKIRHQSLSDITIKISKILTIAKSDYLSLINKDEVCWRFGLKQYAQLSSTESDVMMLIGRGYDSTDISKMLKRSRKTISTHYRNASRKIGVSNRAEFYRFASLVASCQHGQRNTICL